MADEKPTVTGEEQPTPGSPKTEEQPTPGSSGSPQTEEQQAAKPQEESTAQESTTILGQAQETVEKLDVLGVGKTDVAQQTQKSMKDLSNYANRIGKVASFAFVPPKPVDGEMRKYKVLIVMSDTGGGHKASANSIAAALKSLYGDEIEVVIADILEDYTLWASNKMYNWWSSMPWLWGTIYNSTKRTHSLSGNVYLLDPARAFEPTVLPGFIRCTQEHRPDCIISVHPILQSAPRATSSHVKNGKNIPFMTVVTDLGEAHPWWFNKGLDQLVVPTEAMKEQAQTLGLKAEQVAVCGLPVREGFWDVEAATAERKRELKEKLGLDTELPIALLVGGGEGMGKLREVAQGFFKHIPKEGQPAMQVVIVCGSNKELQKSLSKEAESAPGAKAGMVYSVQGFVNNMDEWMQASTVIVTKAGPGTIAEACCCGLPILLYDFLAGQEEGNVTFVKENGLGEWLPEAKKVAQRAGEVVADPALLEQYNEACRKNARPRAALDIAENTKRLILERWTGDEEEEGAEGGADAGAAEGERGLEGAAGGEDGKPAGNGSPGTGKPAAKYELRTSWWSWFSPTGNTEQGPSWWRERKVPT